MWRSVFHEPSRSSPRSLITPTSSSGHPPHLYYICQGPPEIDGLVSAEVLYKWTGAPLDMYHFGWYRGTVWAPATNTQKTRHPGVNYEIEYFNKDTGNVLPACDGVYGRRSAKYAVKLDMENWGPDKQWVVIEPGESTGGRSGGNQDEGVTSHELMGAAVAKVFNEIVFYGKVIKYFPPTLHEYSGATSQELFQVRYIDGDEEDFGFGGTRVCDGPCT